MVCVLSPEEAIDLDRKNLQPSCSSHRHISTTKAELLVSQGGIISAAKWLGKEKRYLVFELTQICVLSPLEAKRLVETDRSPCCLDHDHLSDTKAHRLIGDQGAEWVGRSERRITIHPPRVWRPVNSVLQLVEGVIQGRKGHFNCPAGARGARGRNTSVYATNLEPRPLNLLHGTT